MTRTLLLLLCLVVAASTAFEFNISQDGSTLLKDGVPSRVISGSFHYFRVPSAEWPQRFATLAASGLNTIQTYIAWNVHCPTQGAACDFSGDRNISYFFDLAQQYGLQVMLRPGPYICAEWDLGGFPAWMLPTVGVPALRTSDPLYMHYVEKWWNVLLPIVQSHLYVVSGGPIVMVQVENEYGSFGNDTAYLTALRDLLRAQLGPKVLLYSTDADYPTNIRNTAIEGVFQAVDFFYYGWWDQNVLEAWANQHVAADANRNMTRGPNFNDEFYPGWFTQWFDPFRLNHTVAHVLNLTTVILNPAISGQSNLNFYMFFGGTNFGYWPGYRVTTSYDYGAPMNESGHVTPLYTALAPVLRAASGMPVVTNVSQPPPLVSYGMASFSQYVSLWNTRVLEWLASSVVYVDPTAPLPTMESLGQHAGMMVYEFQVRQNVTSLVMTAHDYALVALDGVVVGHLIRGLNDTITLAQSTYVDTVWILVDHDGRHNGWAPGTPTATLSKGLRAEGVIINNAFTPQNGYMIYTLPLSWPSLMDAAPWQPWPKATSEGSPIPAGAAYQATFRVTAPSGAASMLDVSHTVPNSLPFRRGQAFLNGHALGRYWTAAGPQKALYVPASFLCSAANCDNVLIVVEVGGAVWPQQTLAPFQP